eukprot:c9704_g1_i2.p1 GENE.c9704_g1_i2~~c9704_g1_i2.p1  ORF type:complete len:646 (+),score=183.64 c9704_g1_i2:55-1992(+)
MFAGEDDGKSKFDEIVNILVAAGYFRARLTSLTPFDRIIGGMCWGITASAVDVDVDVVFQENSTIGQKIKISDQIVKSLRRMRCPYSLMSHQIQGLDYPSLFPVCQWLVLKVIETRQSTGDVVRLFSEAQFNKSMLLPQEAQRAEDAQVSMPYVQTVLKRYGPQRRYRRTTDSFKTPSAHVHSVLLEYGAMMKATVVQDVTDESTGRKRPQSTRMSIGADGEIRGDPSAMQHGADGDMIALAQRLGVSASTIDAESIAALAQESTAVSSGLREKDDNLLTDAERAAKAKAEQLLESLRDQLQETADDEGVIKASRVGALVGLQSEAIKQAAAELATIQAKEAGTGITQLQVLERQNAALSRQLEAQQTRFNEITSRHDAVKNETNGAQAQLSKAKAYNDRVISEINKLKEREQGKDQADLAKLRRLVTLNEHLKQQEIEFRETCKRQRDELRALLKAAEQAVSEDDEEKMKTIEAMFEKDQAKFAKVRGALAHKNQEIALIARMIDEMPTRTELIQYEKSFVELYDQVSAKLEETRRFYDQYNTLESKKKVLQSEVKLLDSVYEWFSKNVANKQRVLEAMQTYCTSTNESLGRARSKLTTETQALEECTTRYNTLVEQQRKYFKAVKEFQDECTKNERLTESLAE